MNKIIVTVYPLKIACELIGFKPSTLRKKALAGVYPSNVIWKNSCGSWLVDIAEWEKWQKSHQ